MKTFVKRNKDDKIWWYIDTEQKSDFAFSFDKQKIFYVFADYDKLTKRQKEIFDRENPYWKDFFSGKGENLALF